MQRKVFGRRKFEVDGRLWKCELRKDGLWLREHRHHREWMVPLDKILTLCGVQTELFTNVEMKGRTHVSSAVSNT